MTEQDLPELDPERLAAILEGRNDPGYDPTEHPIVRGDETEQDH